MTTIQLQNSTGTWNERALETLTWCGVPVVLTPDQMAALTAGKPVRFASDWYAKIRLPQTARKLAPPVASLFTCPTCGEHRDTTRPGLCDDCDN